MTPALAAAVKQPHGPLVKPKIEPGTGAGVAKKPGMPPMMPGMGMPGMPPFGMPPGMMMPGMGMFPPGGRTLFSSLRSSSGVDDTFFASCSPLLLDIFSSLTARPDPSGFVPPLPGGIPAWPLPAPGGSVNREMQDQLQVLHHPQANMGVLVPRGAFIFPSCHLPAASAKGDVER